MENAPGIVAVDSGQMAVETAVGLVGRVGDLQNRARDRARNVLADSVRSGGSYELDPVRMEEGVRTVRNQVEEAVGEDKPRKVDPLEELEPKDRKLMLGLKLRFQKNEPLHERVRWSDVETALLAHPKEREVLRRMEDSGGEPDVILSEEGHFVFGDCYRGYDSSDGSVTDLPKARKGLSYFESLEMAHVEIGVELMSESVYARLDFLMNVDRETSCWLKSDEVAEIRRALVGRGQWDEDDPGRTEKNSVIVHHDSPERKLESRAWRGMLKIPKA